MTLSEIAVRQLMVQFSIEKEYSKRTCQIETSFSEEKWLTFVQFKEKDSWEAAVFLATAQVNTGSQTPATVATEKPPFGEIVAIFAIGLLYFYFHFPTSKSSISNSAIIDNSFKGTQVTQPPNLDEKGDKIHKYRMNNKDSNDIIFEKMHMSGHVDRILDEFSPSQI